jgi:hypothetical protein
MHSRVYAERYDGALKKMVAAVQTLQEQGKVTAPALPVNRDPRITELLRMEYAADVLAQLANAEPVETPKGKGT